MNIVDLVSMLARANPEMRALQHFEVDVTIYDCAKNLAVDTLPECCATIPLSQVCVPQSSRPPARNCTLIIGAAVFILSEDANPAFPDHVLAGIWTPFDPDQIYQMGGWRPGGGIQAHGLTYSQLRGGYMSADECHSQILILAHLVSLINEPRIVARHPGGTRQQRRAAQRGMGFAVDAWTRVSWDLSKETVAKISRDPTFHKVPLHFRRGHFRQAQPHYKGAIQRPDAIRVEDRELWWQWIEEQWVGHPAFGIKRSVHAPRLSTGELARRRVA